MFELDFWYAYFDSILNLYEKNFEICKLSEKAFVVKLCDRVFTFCLNSGDLPNGIVLSSSLPTYNDFASNLEQTAKSIRSDLYDKFQITIDDVDKLIYYNKDLKYNNELNANDLNTINYKIASLEKYKLCLTKNNLVTPFVHANIHPESSCHVCWLLNKLQNYRLTTEFASVFKTNFQRINAPEQKLLQKFWKSAISSSEFGDIVYMYPKIVNDKIIVSEFPHIEIRYYEKIVDSFKRTFFDYTIDKIEIAEKRSKIQSILTKIRSI